MPPCQCYKWTILFLQCGSTEYSYCPKCGQLWRSDKALRSMWRSMTADAIKDYVELTGKETYIHGQM